ncbi:MAG: Uncharacterised protein [Bacteroidota bacterium]|nr:MAG: Uncharacterised protein [Bacteroidota bacterium]
MYLSYNVFTSIKLEGLCMNRVFLLHEPKNLTN